ALRCPPPRPPPVPYTPLFRSAQPPRNLPWDPSGKNSELVRELRDVRAHLLQGARRQRLRAAEVLGPQHHLGRFFQRDDHPRRGRSEEHTSESSHGSISYAVFC